MVAHALRTYPCLELVPALPEQHEQPGQQGQQGQLEVLGGPGLGGHGLTEQQMGLVQRFTPGVLPAAICQPPAELDTIGFFVAKFRRVAAP